MPQQTINIGSTPDDGTGDTIRVGGDKINDNFTELYTDKLDKSGGTLTGDLIVPDEVYDATTWNGSLEVPTKNAVRDKIESLGSGITELDDVPDVNAPTPANGDVLTWDSTPGEWVATPPPGASMSALDDLTDVDAPTPSDGDVLTFDSGSGDWVNQAPSGGSAAWALAGTGQTATGVYDFAVDGAKANIDFIGLASFNELLIIVRGLTNGTSGIRALRASVDNGSTFYAASGDYVGINAAGVEAADTAFAYHNTASTGARGFVAHVLNTKGAAKACITNNAAGIHNLFVASASDINAVRVYNTGGGNFTAGTVRVYAR